MSTDILRLVAPSVCEVRAGIALDLPEHVDWQLGYAPEQDAEGRYLIARLYAANEAGQVHVILSAALVGGDSTTIDEGEPAEAFEAQLVASHVLDSLYALARVTAHGILGTIEAPIDLPIEMPSPTVSRLVRTAQAEGSSTV